MPHHRPVDFQNHEQYPKGCQWFLYGKTNKTCGSPCLPLMSRYWIGARRRGPQPPPRPSERTRSRSSFRSSSLARRASSEFQPARFQMEPCACVCVHTCVCACACVCTRVYMCVPLLSKERNLDLRYGDGMVGLCGSEGGMVDRRARALGLVLP
eukprot:1160151-Pelagomonas_calceolata.AAC.3